MKVAQDAYTVFVVCLGLSVPLTYILFNTSPYAASSSPKKYWWVWLIAIIVTFGLVLFVSQLHKFPPLVSAVASVALVSSFIVTDVREVLVEHVFRVETVALWFFLVIMVTIVEIKIRTNRKLIEGGEWSKPLVTLFVVLLVFAQYYYPNLKASWGGGTPVSVTISFTKDSAISPSKTVSAQLIEEADEGFYIVGPNESRAIYVPRNAVSFIYFSDKVSDSQLLRNDK
jgi:hypothetical protein